MTLEQGLISDPGGGGGGMTLEPALISGPGVGDDSRTSLDIRPWGRGWLLDKP